MPVPQRFMPSEAMDPDYLTGQRPADVLIMCSDDTKGDYCLVTQGKTGQKLRILMRTDAWENSLGRLAKGMSAIRKFRNAYPKPALSTQTPETQKPRIRGAFV